MIVISIVCLHNPFLDASIFSHVIFRTSKGDKLIPVQSSLCIGITSLSILLQPACFFYQNPAFFIHMIVISIVCLHNPFLDASIFSHVIFRTSKGDKLIPVQSSLCIGITSLSILLQPACFFYQNPAFFIHMIVISIVCLHNPFLDASIFSHVIFRTSKGDKLIPVQSSLCIGITSLSILLQPACFFYQNPAFFIHMIVISIVCLHNPFLDASIFSHVIFRTSKGDKLINI